MEDGKECTRCGKWKLLTRFYKTQKRKGGYHPQCKKCCRSQATEFYHRNPGPYRKRALIARKKISAYLNRVANKIKKREGCCECGEETLCVLDYHHHKERGMPVSRAACHSYKKFEEEINKCVILCANCHRKTHAGLIIVSDDKVLNVRVKRKKL